MKMSADLVQRNESSVTAIADHLRACDDSFVPPLGSRVEIDDYAAKIVARAERFEAWSGSCLVGLLAAYCNDPARKVAFVTSVSVLPGWQGQGVASRLLRACVEHARQGRLERIELEVDPRNSAATLLYQKHGFAIACAHDQTQTWQLAL